MKKHEEAPRSTKKTKKHKKDKKDEEARRRQKLHEEEQHIGVIQMVATALTAHMMSIMPPG